MQKLKKIDEQTNVLTWFEIPVEDIQRAKRFYETILDIRMVEMTDGEEEAAFFPFDPDEISQALSGRITGVLSKSSDSNPSQNGVVIYINASPSIQAVLDKVEAAGGEILEPMEKFGSIGFIAKISDSEGNRIGLHSEL